MADEIEQTEAPILSFHLYASGRINIQGRTLVETPIVVLRLPAGGVQVAGLFDDPGQTILLLAEGLRAVLNHHDKQRAAARAEKPTIVQPPPGMQFRNPWTNGR